MAKVLCFGSLNIDYVYTVDHVVKKGETISSSALHVYSGGKGLNQSVALGKAGCETWHAGVIGQDGLFLLDVLKEAGVNTSLITISETEKTGNAIIQNDSLGDNCIILYPGANHSITRKLVDRVLTRFEAGDYLIVQNEINHLDYIVSKAKEAGMIVILNPSPFNERLSEEILCCSDWLILNEIEAMQLTGCESENGDVLAEAIKNIYPQKHFVLTLGEHGSSCFADGKLIRQGPFPVKTIDSTAAGDTFTGYFITSLIKGLTLQECLKIAAKAASIAVSRRGAAPSIPYMWEVLENM